MGSTAISWFGFPGEQWRSRSGLPRLCGLAEDPRVGQLSWHVASPFNISLARHLHRKQVTPARWERLDFFFSNSIPLKAFLPAPAAVAKSSAPLVACLDFFSSCLHLSGQLAEKYDTFQVNDVFS